MLVSGVNLARTYRMIYLLNEIYNDREDWNTEIEKSPFDHKELNRFKKKLELIQLGSEINGRSVNLYA